MPNCFQLIGKETHEPTAFEEIDDAMCAHFGVEPDKKTYYRWWYDIVGLHLACGKTLPQLREEYRDDDEYLPIIEYLDDRYTSIAWVER